MRKSAILCVVWSCISSGVAAQEILPRAPAAGTPQSIDDVREEYRMHVGPVYAKPAVLLKQFGIDSNVFYQAESKASDFTFTIGPQADIAVPFARRGLLTTRLGSDLVYFAHYSSERSVDPFAVVRGEMYARRLTLFVEDSFLNSRQRLNFEVDARARHLENQLSVGAAFRFTPRLSLELARGHNTISFDDNAIYGGQYLRDTLNRDEDLYSATARFKHSVLTNLGLRLEAQTDRFVFSPVRNADSFRIMPGVELKPKALISGSAWVGFRSFNPKASVLPAQSGLAADLALSYTLLGATTFGVTYQRDYNFAYEVLTPYYVANSVGVSVRRAVGGRFDVILNAANHRYAFQALQALPSGIAQSSPILAPLDTTRTYGINLGRKLSRQTRIGFDVSHWRRRSNDATRDYDDFRVGLTTTHGF
jgi:hypothetical protein